MISVVIIKFNEFLPFYQHENILNFFRVKFRFFFPVYDSLQATS